MTIQFSGPIKLSDISAEFGEREGPVLPGTRISILLSDYYAGNPGSGFVRAGTVGYPNGVSTVIPSVGSPLKLSNFYGATAQFTTQFFMTGIYGTNSCCSDNDYFGGDIPRTFSWTTRYSNYYQEFTVPEGYSTASLTTYGFSVQLGCSYSWYDGGAYSSTDYYYDYMRYFGIAVYNVTDGVQVGTVINNTDQNQWTGPYYNTFSVPGGSVSLTAGKTYRVYYTCDFFRQSDVGYGDVSFGWYNNSVPYISVVAS
jgi:hypothetical protein